MIAALVEARRLDTPEEAAEWARQATASRDVATSVCERLGQSADVLVPELVGRGLKGSYLDRGPLKRESGVQHVRLNPVVLHVAGVGLFTAGTTATHQLDGRVHVLIEGYPARPQTLPEGAEGLILHPWQHAGEYRYSGWGVASPEGFTWEGETLLAPFTPEDADRLLRCMLRTTLGLELLP